LQVHCSRVGEAALQAIHNKYNKGEKKGF